MDHPLDTPEQRANMAAIVQRWRDQGLFPLARDPFRTDEALAEAFEPSPREAK